MKNRILAISRNMIPYCKEINTITGGVLATILMQQMDYWFDRKPDGFYKFLEPCNHKLYTPGDSWCEELGFSKTEFRNSFDAIGFRHASKSTFDSDPDKFHGKMYASYVDRRNNLTIYIRNHSLADRALEDLARRIISPKTDTGSAGARNPEQTQVIDFKAHHETAFTGDLTQPIDFKAHHETAFTGNHETASTGNSVSGFTANHETQSPVNQQTGFTANRETRSLQITKRDLPYTETTAETTKTDTTTTTRGEGSSSSKNINIENIQPDAHGDQATALLPDLFYPQVDPLEIEEIKRMMSTCPQDFQQLILDETEGQRRKGFKKSAISFALSLVNATHQGAFRPNLAIGIARERQKRRKTAAVTGAQSDKLPFNEMTDVSSDMLDKLPPGLRQRHIAGMQLLQSRTNKTS